MSAPQTNIDKQERRHVGPLVGMALVVVFGVGLIVYWVYEEAAGAENPVGTAEDEVELIDGGNGEELPDSTTQTPDAATPVQDESTPAAPPAEE